MKLTAQMFQEVIGSIISEQQWNKNSNTPRDYSEEYDAPGSKDQEERNKRKRDKRKHDKEHGECPEGEELHHVDGIDGDMLECEPVSTNRGRKEKSRLKKGEKEKKDTRAEKEKKGEIAIKIAEHQLKKIIQEEAEKVLSEADIDQPPEEPEPEEPEPEEESKEEKRAQQVSAVHSMLKGEKPKPPAKTKGVSPQTAANNFNKRIGGTKLK